MPPRRTPNLANRFEHAGIRAARLLAAPLPGGVRRSLAGGLGFLARRVFGVRRELVREQLELAFPEADEAFLRETEAAAYRHLALEGMAMLRMGAMSPDEVRERTHLHGWDAFHAAVQAGKGVVIATGHLGNWEMGGAAMAVRGIPLDVVAQRQSNPLFDREVNDVREALGMRVIDRNDAPRQVTRALRRGRAVAFVADQDARRNGVFVPFFGRPASTHRGPALFAVRAGCPLFLGVAVRRDDGDYDVRYREIVVEREGPTDDVVVRLTAAFTAALEDEIRRVPGQYLWLHRRWKTRPRRDGHGTGSGSSRV